MNEPGIWTALTVEAERIVQARKNPDGWVNVRIVQLPPEAGSNIKVKEFALRPDELDKLVDL